MIKQQLASPEVIPLTIGGWHSLGIFVAGQSDIAILMISGGAQIRSGSHRMQQQLATALQQQQISSLRFDFPGYGDAEGLPQDFIQHANWLPEVLTAAQQATPQIKHWLIFGLCDGASAILLNQQALQQTAGLILLNPWCRAAQNHAKTMVRFYYWQRLCSADFWRKLLSGHSKPLQSLQQFFRFCWQAQVTNPQKSPAKSGKQVAVNGQAQYTSEHFLPVMLDNWCSYTKPVLLALSETDLTAQECSSLLAQLPKQRQKQIAANTSTKMLVGANHTCSEAKHFLQLQQFIKHWLKQHFPG